MSANQEQPALFSVPRHITELPDITWAYIRIYETIFQFLCRGKSCYLSTKMIMERTGIASEGSVRGALIYFEKHNVLKRVIRGKRRFIELTLSIEEDDEPVDNTPDGGANSDHGVNPLTPTRQPADGLPVSALTHKNIIESSNINKSISKRGKTVDNPSAKQFWGVGHPSYDSVNRCT